MNYKIILVINRNTNMSVCKEYCSGCILLDKCTIQTGRKLRIVFLSLSYFEHEVVESVEGFEEHGLKVTTTKKIWFIHQI